MCLDIIHEVQKVKQPTTMLCANLSLVQLETYAMEESTMQQDFFTADQQDDDWKITDNWVLIWT